jgi:hypothetical protein
MTERLVALAMLAVSGAYLANALTLPQGTAARPGPGFFPVAVGAVGAIVALVWVATAFRRAPVEGREAATAAGGYRRVSVTATLLVGFCLALPWTGYPLGAFLFVAGLLRGLGAGWLPAVATGLTSAAVSYYLFGPILGVPLPPGIFFE